MNEPSAMCEGWRPGLGGVGPRIYRCHRCQTCLSEKVYWDRIVELECALEGLVTLVEEDPSFNDPAGEPDSYAALVTAKLALNGGADE